MNIKEAVKSYAYKTGADLVGFGNIERCKNAPLMMSPQGLMPSAKTVIVMAVHHPDAAIEQGGEEHPQELGPYYIQYVMNARLDEMSYQMGTFLEDLGYNAIPICSSNIWRYNKYKDLNAIFAPDVSNIYMPVVAGLADMGFNGLALTPEYGARNRFVTVITNAVIEPDPLIPPGTNCDNCMLCRKNCPAQALFKEIDGKNVLEIENYRYTFPKKNLWRCAWGEHFDLDLDLEIPDVVNEKVILETAHKYGLRNGEMGQCLKYCLPKKKRYFDQTVSSAPLRKYHISYNEELESRAVTDRLLTECSRKGVEYILVNDQPMLTEMGLDITSELPHGQTAITLVSTMREHPENIDQADSERIQKFGLDYQIDFAGLDLTRKLEELGFSSVMTCKWPNPITGTITANTKELAGQKFIANTVLTAKKLKPEKRGFNNTPGKIAVNNETASLTKNIKNAARRFGADLVGTSSADRLDKIAAQISSTFKEEIIYAEDNSHKFEKWEPAVKTETRTVRKPGDYLKNAKSVIVFSLRYHGEVLRQVTKPPAEAVGPYSFQTYVTEWYGAVITARIIQELEHFGYQAVASADLLNTGSRIASPRGLLEDTFCNRFAAYAAGLGTFTETGRIATPEFGLRQRFFAVITDADLNTAPLLTDKQSGNKCKDCAKMCLNICPTKAFFGERVTFTCEDRQINFAKTDQNLCDWSKKYALSGNSGFKYLGSDVNEDPGSAVTEKKLTAALKKHDPIKKARPVVAEPCQLVCPYFNTSA
ncbi:MAG TPA: hypothetical protein VKS21_07640 [Spirochaetota bacterium]|nr:hypothetical protein [Spirochaetota bacterium]